MVIVFFIQINYFNPRTPLQSAIVTVKLTSTPKIYFNPRTPLQSAIPVTDTEYWALMVFQSTHSITECDQQCWERGF